MERLSNVFAHGARPQQHQAAPISWSFIAMSVALVIVTLAGTAGFFWYLSYGFDNPPVNNLTIQHIEGPAAITWHESGLASIESDDTSAMLAALGYVHAREQAWQMILWRQTALGNLTAWYGPSLLRLDRLSKQLRLADIAQQTYEELPAHRKMLLDAYAEGINQSINLQSLLAHDEFAFLDTDITPWKPWHTLAVERLFAWTTTTFAELDSLPPDHVPALENLIASDKLLHQFLQIYDFQYSYAGVWEDPNERDNSYFYQRLVYGASAHSIIQEVSLTRQNGDPFFVATLPGTLIFLAGHGEQQDWSILPASEVHIDVFKPEKPPVTSYERITNRDGTEFLATFSHFPGVLSLENAYTPETDSLYVLYWRGFDPGTDVFEFLGMLDGNKPALHLFSGDGLWIENQQTEILGAPAYQYPFDDGLMISSVPWPAYVATYLDSLGKSQPELLNPKMWTHECFNPWAAEHAPMLLNRILDASSQFDGEMYRDAITYLRNWDFSYNSSSIGSAIFEQWLIELGFPTASRRLSFDDQIDDSTLVPTFKRAVNNLNHAFDSDLSQWRLEQTQPVYRYYPAWAVDSLYSPDDTPLSQTNYAPLRFPGKGDVVTLCGGSFEGDEFGIVSAQWESWSARNINKRAWYWRKQVTPESFLERYLISNRPSLEYRFGALDHDPVHFTQITPAQ